MSKPLTEGKTKSRIKHQEPTTRPISPPPIRPKMSKREEQWKEFSDVVAEHMRNYTVPQYGDVGEDEITNYSVEDCVNHISRYSKRYGTQSREGQQELDFMKIAHYAQCAWDKQKKGMVVYPIYHLSYSEKQNYEYIELGYIWVGVTLDEKNNEIDIYKEK